MTLPEIRDRLMVLSHLVDDEVGREIRHLCYKMKRRKARTRVASSVPMTPELRQEIREFYENNKHLSQAEMGRHFNVNPGRISETLRGYRS